MANKLLEELFEMKSKFDDLRKEEIANIIDFISKDKITMSSTKYLIDNFEKVKSKTIADFWIELANKIKNKFNCAIEFFPKIVDITDYENFEDYLSDNKTFEIHFTLNLYFQKGVRLGEMKINEEENGQKLEPKKIFIGNEFGECLYLGQKNDPLEIKNYEKMEISERLNLFKYVIDKREWRRYLFSDRTNNIKLSDFSHQATFDLIDKNKRNEKIIQICKEIEYFLQRYCGIITNDK
jgi:hypothetical protein